MLSEPSGMKLYLITYAITFTWLYGNHLIPACKSSKKAQLEAQQEAPLDAYARSV